MTLQSINIDWTKTEVCNACDWLHADMTGHGSQGGGHTRDHSVRITWQSHATSVPVCRHGSHSGGGRRVSLQGEKTVCVSPRDGPRRTGPPGSGWTDSYKCTNHRVCVWFLLAPNCPSHENRPFCHAGVCYRRCFHHSTEISLHFSFLSSPFELESTPHHHHSSWSRPPTFISL